MSNFIPDQNNKPSFKKFFSNLNKENKKEFKTNELQEFTNNFLENLKKYKK